MEEYDLSSYSHSTQFQIRFDAISSNTSEDTEIDDVLIYDAGTDTVPPVITVPDDITAEATGTLTTISIGTATAIDDTDPNPSITNDAPASFQLGATTVTWTATDSAGNAATDTQTITIQDTVPPALAVPSDVQAEVTCPGTAVNLGSATATDIIDSNPTITNDAPAQFPPGATTVIWTATDSAGNAATDTQTVTVRDTTDPAIMPIDDLVTVFISTTDYSNLAPTVTDNSCDDIMPKHNAPDPFPLGPTMVTWTATDDSGNSDSTTHTVTIVDIAPPIIMAPVDVTAEVTCPGTTVDLGQPAYSDNYDPNPEITNDAPASFQLGTATVLWTATDSSGNTATDAQLVTIRDTVPPVITSVEDVIAEITGQLTPVSLVLPGTSENSCEVVTPTNDATGSFPLGDTIVTWSAADVSGNMAILTQRITIQDTTPPVITAPADVTAESTGILTAVSIGTATAIDVSGVTPTITNDAPDSFPLGDTTVTWSATDASGNTATIPQTVTIQDTTPPVITAPADVTAEITGIRTAVFLGMATATDIADPNPVIAKDAPDSFPLGDTTVTWSATDASGNTATIPQTVTIQDTTPPVITAPADVIAEYTDVLTTVSIGTATAIDVSGVTPTITNDAPDSFQMGDTTITWTATDASGNTATAIQSITIQDTTPPVITAPADVTAEYTDVLTTVSIGMATATDIADPNPKITNSASASFPLGDTLVIWTATDSSGNQAIDTQTITVQKTVPPITPLETITAAITNTSTPNGGTHTSADISYVVTFDESVTDFTRTDIDVSGTASVTSEGVHNFNELGDDGLIWTFSLDATSDGTLTVSIPPNVVMGADDSVNMASNTYTVTLDIFVPVATFQSSIDRLAGDFRYNRGIAVNSAHILVADTYNNRIRVFDLDGNFVSTFGNSYASGNGQFKKPFDITVTPTRILVADLANHRIQIFDLDGNYVDKFGKYGSGNGMLKFPTGITTTPTHIVVPDRSNNRIQIFDLDGNHVNTFGSRGSGNGEFHFPTGVTTTSTNILVADRNNHRIQVFDLDGNYLSKFGSRGSGNGQFYLPEKVTTTPAYILVADSRNDRIQVHDRDGNYISTIGSRGTGNDQFDRPAGITTNSTHMLISDIFNQRVQIYDLSPTVAITSDTPNGGTHNSNTISYTATFSEDVTDFAASDITVSGTASGGTPTVSNFAGTGTTYTFEVTATSGGTVTVSVPKLAASDAGHNFNRASDEYTVTVA